VFGAQRFHLEALKFVTLVNNYSRGFLSITSFVFGAYIKELFYFLF
jgi:hypothetical protein